MDIQDVQFPAVLPAARWHRQLTVKLGRLTAALLPQRAAAVARGELPQRLGRIDRWLIAALVDRQRRVGNLGALSPLHHWLWRGEQAVSFHEQATARYASWWLRHHVAIVEPIRELLDAPASPYHRLCEIGCGSGLVLQDLARRLPQLHTLTGLDLSPHQTELNRQREVDLRIRFESGDARNWIPAHAQPGTIYLTVAGVFEYFAEADLQALFTTLARDHAPAAVALIEPIPNDPDFEHESAPRSYGPEHSLGHHYARLLRRAGFDVRYQQLQDLGSIRFVLLVAECRTAAPAPRLH